MLVKVLSNPIPRSSPRAGVLLPRPSFDVDLALLEHHVLALGGRRQLLVLALCSLVSAAYCAAFVGPGLHRRIGSILRRCSRQVGAVAAHGVRELQKNKFSDTYVHRPMHCQGGLSPLPRTSLSTPALPSLRWLAEKVHDRKKGARSLPPCRDAGHTGGGGACLLRVPAHHRTQERALGHRSCSNKQEQV